MKTHVVRIDRVTVKMEGHDKRYQIPNPYHPRFYVLPTKVVAEFSHGESDVFEAILAATVTGQRYRLLAAGPKAVGPGRGDPSEPTTWKFPTRDSMPQELVDMLYDVYRWAFWATTPDGGTRP